MLPPIVLPDADPNRALDTLSVLWERSFVGLAIVAEDGRFMRVNPVFCGILEYSEAELTNGRRWQDLTHPEDLAPDNEMAKEIAHGDRIGYDMKKRYLSKFGRIPRCLMRVESVWYPSGQFAWYIVQVQELAGYDTTAPAVEVHRQRPKLLLWAKQNWSTLVLISTLIGITLAAMLKTLLGIE